jgi:hypothetical protein
VSATQSFLADPAYGYDFVVATTQASINSTLRQFLHEVGEPLVEICFIAGPGGSAQQIDYADLIARAHGSDPFAVPPDADPRTDPDLFNLAKAGFLAGFRAQIGIPPVSNPATIKTLDLVTLGSAATSVTFHLLCSEFDAVQLDAHGSTWLSVSQQVDQPWVFTAAVDLRLANVPGEAFGTLPAQVQDQIKNLSGSALSVQQLLFDLDNATLLAVPQMTGVPDNTALSKLLSEYFIGAYFGQLQLAGQPMLGCVVADQTASAATLAPTDLTIGSSPYIGATTPSQQALSCLTYLCVTGGHALPGPAAFRWNWVDQAEAEGCDGVVAVSRSVLVAQLIKQMLPMVKANCYKPSVRVTTDFDLQPAFSISVAGGQDPQTIDTSCLDMVIVDNPSHPPNFRILHFGYDASASDHAGAPGAPLGAASMDSHYQANVTTSGNMLQILQFLNINLSVSKYGQTTSGTPIAITRIDRATFTVNEFGELVTTMSTPAPASNTASAQTINSFTNFWLGLNEKYGDVASYLQNMAGTLANTIPLAMAQCFVFPGGQTFSYKSAAFSQHGDLVSHVVYADPDQAPPGPVRPYGQVAGRSQMLAGQWIPNDGYLISKNKLYAAVLQDDGNFVLVHCTNGGPDLKKPYWSVAANKPAKYVGTFTGTPCLATMQADGNFVLYNGRDPIEARAPYWATGTVQTTLGGYYADMQDDANFVIYRGSPGASAGVLFATDTNTTNS